MDFEQKQAEMQKKLDSVAGIATELKTATETIAELKKANDELKGLLGERKEGDTSTIEQKFALLDKSLEEMKNQLKEAAEAKEDEFKTLGDALLDLSKKAEFKELAEKITKKDSSKTYASFEIKANLLTTALTGDRQRSLIESGVDKPVLRQPFMRNILANIPTSSPVIYWTERTAHTNGVGGVAEGAAAGASDSTWEEKSRKMVKRGVSYKYSNESFSDIPQLIADLREDVNRDMDLDIDDQIINGDGTGNNFAGILADATAFNATTVGVAAKIINPNLADLIKCAATQIELEHRMPTHVFLNPVDMNKLELEKDTTGQYVLPPFKSMSGLEISGIQVIKNTGILANSLLMLDRTAPRFYVSRDVAVNVWYQNEDDAKKDMKTVTLFFRGQVRVRENDKKAIVKVANITTALADIKKP